MTHAPASFSRTMAWARLTWTISRCSLAAAEAFTTAGVTVAARASGISTPCTPVVLGSCAASCPGSGVLHQVESQDEERFTPARGQIEDIVQAAVRIAAGFERPLPGGCRSTCLIEGAGRAQSGFFWHWPARDFGQAAFLLDSGCHLEV